MNDKLKAFYPWFGATAWLAIMGLTIATAREIANHEGKDDQRVSELTRRVDRLENVIEQMQALSGDMKAVRVSIDELNRRLDRSLK